MATPPLAVLALAMLLACSSVTSEPPVTPARESVKAETLGNDVTILVDNEELTLALGSSPRYLELRAIIWPDGDRRLGRTEKGRRIGDYSTVILDFDSDGIPTANRDRYYSLNPWPDMRGVFYTTEVGGRVTTQLTREPKAQGKIKYVKSGVGRRTRVDWYRIPLEAMPVQRDSLGLCFFAFSAVPQLRINSVGYAPPSETYYSYNIPLTLCHRLILEEQTLSAAPVQGDGNER